MIKYIDECILRQQVKKNQYATHFQAVSSAKNPEDQQEESGIDKDYVHGVRSSDDDRGNEGSKNEACYEVILAAIPLLDEPDGAYDDKSEFGKVSNVLGFEEVHH